MKLRRAITFSEADLSVKADLVSPPWQPWLKRAVQTLGRRVFLSIEDCGPSVLSSDIHGTSLLYRHLLLLQV